MKISIAQNNTIWEDFDQNLDLVLRNIQLAGNAESDLVIFPEMTLSGFSMNVDKVALPPSNQYFDKICNRAAKMEVAVVFGAAVKEKNKYYNRLVFINAEGTIQGTYDKIHPFSFSGEHEHYASGKSIPVFKLNGVKLCAFICYDLRFPEIFVKAADDVDLFFIIANWPQKRIDHWKTLLKARSLDTLSYVVGVNRTGNDLKETYNGNSMAFSPWGESLHDAEEKEFSSFTIDLTKVQQVRNKFSLLKDRRI